jgi:hypothetical protein
VVRLKLLLPGVVGVPLTVQVMALPTATLAVVGTVGVHVLVRPAGRPLIAQVAPMLAAAVALALFVQV